MIGTTNGIKLREWQVTEFRVVKYGLPITFHGDPVELLVTETKAPWRVRLRYWLKLASAPVCRTNILDRMELCRQQLRDDELRQFFGSSFSTDGEGEV